jgi:cytochrome c oxidase cbb3-type subunit 3
MNQRAILFSLASITLLVVALLACAGCDDSPVRFGADPAVIPPNEIVEFNFLYSNNCAGCHGQGGKGGAAIALADPVFLAIADDATIRRIAANGVPGTPMSAFAQSAGGMLTDSQVDALVQGIRSWAKSGALQDNALPSYAARAAGDRQRGADVYRTYCSSCHGADGSGGKAGSIVDGSYLALVSDQDLRLNVILGRPAAGAPDWRGDLPGRPMSEQEISDVVAWLAAQRPAIPGQPYPKSAMDRAAGGVR